MIAVVSAIAIVLVSSVGYSYATGSQGLFGFGGHGTTPHTSASSTQSSATSTILSNTNSTQIASNSPPTTYETPNEICSNLPQDALGVASSNPKSSTAYFLIVEADIGTTYTGINGSYFHQNTNWPVLTVYQGQKITIHIVNCPQSPEPHGFAIGHYFNSGVALSAGQADTITFVASATGRFTVFCNIFCAIHQYMQNGELLVVPMP